MDDITSLLYGAAALIAVIALACAVAVVKRKLLKYTLKEKK